MCRMRPIGVELRAKILAAPANLSSSKLSERFGVSGSTIRKLRRRVRDGGPVEADPYPGKPRAIGGADEDCLRALVSEQPDATLLELCDQLREKTGIVTSESTMSRQLRRMGFTRKKSHSFRLNKNELTSRTRVGAFEFA